MKNWLSPFLILFAFAPLQAHQTDASSTMLIEQEDHSWLLSIRAAFTAFEQEVHTHYSDSAYTSPEEFNQLVIEYVQRHVFILVNGKDSVSLSNGFVKLGHETNVIFNVEGIPTSIESIHLSNSAFQDIFHSQSALIILKQGMVKDQFTLNQKNQYTAQLVVEDNSFMLQQERAPFSFKTLTFWGLIGLLVVLGMIFYFRKK